MNIIIQSVNFKTGNTLEKFIQEKVSKLFKHCTNIIRADIVLRKGESGNLENKVCEIRLVIPGYDHFVKAASGVYEKSILLAVKMLQTILRRNNTI